MRMIKNNKGSLVVMVTGLILVSIFIYAVTAMLQSSRQQVTYSSRVEAKKAMIDKTLGLLRNTYIFNYSLANHNSSEKNPKLRTCMTSSHYESTNCTNVPIEFFQPSDISGGSDVKFAGPPSSPFYSDIHGNACLDGEGKPGKNCVFAVVSTCKFECPDKKTYCPLSKIISCDLEVASYGENRLKSFTFSKSNPLFANSFAIRISNNLQSFSVDH